MVRNHCRFLTPHSEVHKPGKSAEFLSHAPSAWRDKGPNAGSRFSRPHDFDNTVNPPPAAPFSAFRWI